MSTWHSRFFCSCDFSHLPDHEFLKDRDGVLLILWSVSDLENSWMGR